jgi:hypothetical protein
LPVDDSAPLPLSAEQRTDVDDIDCGMSHFHDHTIKEALIELAPQEKSSIEAMKFGEITKR